jgi:hypothetical protein
MLQSDGKVEPVGTVMRFKAHFPESSLTDQQIKIKYQNTKACKRCKDGSLSDREDHTTSHLVEDLLNQRKWDLVNLGTAIDIAEINNPTDRNSTVSRSKPFSATWCFSRLGVLLGNAKDVRHPRRVRNLNPSFVQVSLHE